jgi:hypothetical protein
MQPCPPSPSQVVELLTEPDAIARWAPVPFEVLALDERDLSRGARRAGRLAGRCVEFDVDVLRAFGDRLHLVAHGSISIDVQYRLRAAATGSEIEARISGRGVESRRRPSVRQPCFTTAYTTRSATSITTSPIRRHRRYSSRRAIRSLLSWTASSAPIPR